MNLNMRQRIYISISSLVLLFFINGLMTILTLNSNRHSARHLSKVVNPSLESLIDLRKMLLDSKIYSTNWVFLKLNEDDKTALKKIHNSDYPALKSTLLNEASQWENKNWQDSLNKILVGFENVMAIEKNIMTGLDEFKDYNDPIIKLHAERIIEAEVIPRTTLLMKSLNNIRNHWINIRNEESTLVEQSSMKLRVIIISLAIIIFFIGFLHSLFMARLIIQPINKIRQIVNDLGNGIIRNVKDETKDDEIGKMIRSVNNLSDKMKGTAAFATEIGQRNFNSKFEPFGPDDSLGLALITMRDNLKASDEILNEAQHIARLGSWEADMVNNKLFWSDEIYNIFEIENKKLIPTYEKFLQFIHPQDIAYVKAVVEKCMNDHQPMNYECRVIDSKLNIKYINAQGKITVHEKGVAIKLTGIMQDITQRKTAEAELHKSEKQYRQIVETAQEGIWMVDENNLTTFVNKKMCEILEFSVEEITGRKMDLFMLQKADEIKAGTGANRNEKQSYTYTARFITKSGQVVWGSVSNNPIFDDSKKYMGSLAMVTDITKRKYDEELLLQSQDTLLKNNIELEQKNKELEQFAYVASHDLQEPLRTTISFVELLKNQYAGKLDSMQTSILTT